MKSVDKNDKRIVFQGDVAIVRVDFIPKDVKEQSTNIIGHSETGHHHVAERAKVYDAPDGMTLYMQAIGQSIDIVHKRPYDTHETLRLLTKPGDVFKVRRQREHTPGGWVKVQD